MIQYGMPSLVLDEILLLRLLSLSKYESQGKKKVEELASRALENLDFNYLILVG